MPAGLGFLKGLSSALDSYQDQIDRQKHMKLAQIEMQQKQVELQAMQQQAQIAGWQGKLDVYGALADAQGDQPSSSPVQPYSVNQPMPAQGIPAGGMAGGMPGQPPAAGGMQGGLPGARPMPQGAPPSNSVGAPTGMMAGGMSPSPPPQGLMQPGAQRQGAPVMSQPQGVDSLGPPPSVQTLAQAIARRAQQQGLNPPPQAIIATAQQVYPQAMQQWNARREQLQYQQSERDRLAAHEDTEEDRRLTRAASAQSHADSMAMREATMALANQGLSQRGWQIFTGKDGKIYRGNAGTGEVVPMDGAPAGMSRLGQNTGPKTATGMLMQKWKEEHPNYSEDDMQDFLVNNARLITSARLLANKSVPLDQLGNETRATIPVVNELSAKVDRTEYPSVNKLIEAAQQGTGDTNVVRLGIAVATVRDIYARLLNGGGAATDSSREQANGLLNQAWSKGQIGAATDQIMQELDRAQTASQKTGRDIMSRPGDSGVPQIKSDADYAKLPSGAEFIAPDGSHRRKP